MSLNVLSSKTESCFIVKRNTYSTGLCIFWIKHPFSLLVKHFINWFTQVPWLQRLRDKIFDFPILKISIFKYIIKDWITDSASIDMNKQ